ncbi:MAG: FKBP-type peptidyl-prolyl cis-trans isomerase [Candidatus Methylacidiphilales bacterium]|nr:FKBP-type peptidyl-prolyl cis-trans isomerase [Candidatus Methylacidiphilales bacterium]
MQSSRYNLFSRRTAIAVALAGCCIGASLLYAQDPGDPTMSLPAAPPAKPLTDDLRKTASYTIGTEIGKHLSSLQIKLDIEMLEKGIKDSIDGKTSPFTQDQMKEAMLSMQAEAEKNMLAARAKQEEESKKAATANLKVADEFLAKNKTSEGVKVSPKGVQYKVDKEGTGPQPKPEDTVSVHYVGTLLDGKVFDSSVKTGKPAKFPISAVIEGWREIVPMMKVGSKWKIWIPPALAYGEQSPPSIPGNSVLVFELELLGIEPPAAPATPPATPPAPAK